MDFGNVLRNNMLNELFMAEYEEVAGVIKDYKSFVPEDDLKLWTSTHVK